ncbi:DNA topoisomerase IV subunit B [Chitinispirillales bacterium ANBcel5]|uniref:DNA topoisomerase IV subunit B n=1 Tax=Cellulosispirillum alkaliphilum TaxID=3039283 RepID=UPI002A53D47F|nr:DNA topoisomerase IV subunit B [Chitinispirillales bacterium ANBcel5]
MSKNISKSTYDESKIKTLSSLEHIRLRSGMYIGRLGDGSNPDDGIYVLLKEVIDNSIDEFIMGFGKRIDVLFEHDTLSVRDYGRGIPLGKVIDCVSVINTGAKYNDDVFQFSVGLNGVGTKAVNALSSYFKVRSFRDGKFFEAVFSKGKLKSKKSGQAKNEPNGTLVEFTPDIGIFGDYEYNYEYIEQRLWNYAYLNAGLKLYLGNQKFESKNGLLDLLEAEVGTSTYYNIAYYRSKQVEYAFTHTQSYGETYFSFVNGQFTSDGGTHQSAFREGILKGVNEFFKKNFSGVDVREGIAGAVAIKLKSPVFESQTKNKLGNTEIRSWIVSEVKSSVVDFLHKNNEAAKKLESKIVQNEKLRTELNKVKKEAKEAAKRVEIKIPNLKDCKYHLSDGPKGEKSTIFITEGQSAGGSIISARDVYTQAIYTLKGKPQNVFNRTRAAIYQNDELHDMMMALGIEEDFEKLRYNRIVLATDADVDGFHIRNLLLTFFLTYFEELVVAGHVYILETPLFRVRNKKHTRYCYNEKEKNIALKDISNPEVTRFKGLGEISPKEFGQFIGDDIRLVEVNIKSVQNIPETLGFYMGKNTPKRREYIMENLI